MKLTKNKPIVSISRDAFRITIFKFFISHVFLILLFLGFANSKYINHPWSLYFLLGFVTISILISMVEFKFTDFQGRFKDIYPRHELKMYMLIIMMLIPLLYLACTLFLCLKEKKSDQMPFKFFIHGPTFFLATVILFASQFSAPHFAYWSAIPSNYYLYNVAHGAQEIIKLQDQFKKMPEKGSVYDLYTKQKSGNLGTTDLVLLTALSATDVMKKRERSIASEKMEKQESGFKYSIMMLNELNKIIKTSEKSQIEFNDYSLLQWLSPSGPIEIFLLSVVDITIKNEFNAAVVRKMSVILATIEKELIKQPAEIQAIYKADILNIKTNLNSSKTYRSIASVK